jgi:hypothetical protein
MIPQIQEINFPSYATLHEATVSLNEMGERTITTQVRIDGDIVPDFTGWELEFKGERFVLPVKEPQATKDNTTRNSLIDLTFYSWPIYQMKRYFFMSLSEVQTGVAIPDQYQASVLMSVQNFVPLFNSVLSYYFGDKIQMDLYLGSSGIYSTNPVLVEINYSYIWDVLQKFFDLYELRWRIEYDSASDTYTIKVNYPSDEINDHDFEYGYQGGLLKFERQLQDDNVYNIILGRGGEKNLPYRYFKKEDPGSPGWAADPDAIPELANIYFDRLRDINFRWYVRGWMSNSHRNTSWDSTHTFPSYTRNDCPAEYRFAYDKGASDESFNPVEYVKDDDSIAVYGERWGALDDNDEIYPTIQGVDFPDDNPDIGRVDEVVAVSEIVTDDVEAAAEAAATGTNVEGTKTITEDFAARQTSSIVLHAGEITIPSGQVGNLSWNWMNPQFQNGTTADLITLNANGCNVYVTDSQGVSHSAEGIAAGTYRVHIAISATNNSDNAYSNITYGLNSLTLTTSDIDANAWKPTFDVWVKNIWQTTKGVSETEEEYALRVWQPILGDRLGSEAKLIFSDGFMSISQDYEFVIASYPVHDTSKTLNGVSSEWKITLYKSDAEYDVTGLFIPNSQAGAQPVAGNHFFFTGIDMPSLYVQWAEETLNAYKTDYLNGVCDVNPTWVITLDKVRVHTMEASDYNQTLAERLSTGAIVHTKDVRFTAGQAISLYVRTLTYTWSEGDLVPNIEVVLSDKIIEAKGPVTQMQGEISLIRTTYAKTSDIEAVVRKVASPMFLRKTGEAEVSLSPTRFSSMLASRDFRQGGLGGQGWGLYRDNSASYQPQEQAPVTRGLRSAAPTRASSAEQQTDAVMEIDKLVVRKELHVNTLVVNQITYIGGKQVTSAAAIECSQVVETATSYICYFDQKKGTVKNLFVVNDIAMGQVFDAANTEVRYYKMLVTAIGENYIELSKTNKVGSGVPKQGDAIIQYGNTTNADRQYVIIRDVIGGGYDRMLSGLTSLNSNGTEYYFAGRLSNGSPRWFVGDAEGDYAEYYNGKLKIKGDFELEAGSDLAEIISALGVAVSETSKVFTSQPTPPYRTGDIWVNATYSTIYNNDILKVKANVNKAAGASFSIDDWELASGYTSDAALTNFINNTYTPFTTNIGTEVDGKAETYYQSSDPSSNWNTTALKDQHLGDIWYNTSSDSNGFTHTYIYKKSGSTYAWAEINGVPTAVFNTITGKSSIFTSKPTRAYKKDDLWVLETSYTLSGTTYPAGTIVCATTDSSIWSASHWTKKDRYTDDSAISSYQYLQLALANDNHTTIATGGIVLSTFIGVQDSNYNVRAGMNASTALGNDSTHGRLLIFAGSDNAVGASSAKTRIYEDGYLYSENAVIRGTIYAESGEFKGNLVIGESSGRRMEIQSGTYGAMDYFDSAGNLTTHIGNDYCSSIAVFNTGSGNSSVTIPSSSIGVSYSGSGENISFSKSAYYTSRSFTVSGDPSANKLTGNLKFTFSDVPSGMSNYCAISILLYTNSSGTGVPITLANVTFSNSWAEQTIAVSKVIPAGTYYIFYSSVGDAMKEGLTGSHTITMTVSGGSFTVTPIAQRLQIFANGLGYRYSEYQYAALLREASSFSAAGDLAFKMRTGSSSNVVGIDITTGGVKLYGPKRQSLGATSGSSVTNNYSYSISDPSNYSFLEIIAKFNSSAETVSMLMPVATWNGASSSSNAICLSTDSRYVLVYKYSTTVFRIANNNGCSSVAFYGIL